MRMDQTPTWDDIAFCLESATEHMPKNTSLLSSEEPPKPLEFFKKAHDYMNGIAKHRFAQIALLRENGVKVHMGELSGCENMINDVYLATRGALLMAIELQGKMRPAGIEREYTVAELSDRKLLMQLLNRELRDIHTYSDRIGLCDPAGQLIEIFEIARLHQLHGSERVMRALNNMSCGHNLDFDIDDFDKTRIKRSVSDDRISYESCTINNFSSEPPQDEYLRNPILKKAR
jgi:hypothetical protein